MHRPAIHADPSLRSAQTGQGSGHGILVRIIRAAVTGASHNRRHDVDGAADKTRLVDVEAQSEMEGARPVSRDGTKVAGRIIIGALQLFARQAV